MPNIFDNFANANRGKGSILGVHLHHPNFGQSDGFTAPLIDDYGIPVTDDMASNSTTGTIWEEWEQEEMRSQPRGRAEPAPVESAQPGNDGIWGEGRQMSKEEKRNRLKIIREELLFTLASRFNGYTNMDDIKRDFQTDSGYIPDRVAQEYGYQKFEDFFDSDLVKDIYKMVVYDGQPTYVPRDCSKFKHIRDEQMISNDTIVRKEDDTEMEKLARALLPENEEQYIAGKKIILKIMHDLGGETQPILWVRIQEQYKRETGRELAGEELRKLFQRDKALKILNKFFKNEVDAWDSEAPGIFYVQLKKPYGEIVRGFDEMIRSQKEAIRKFRTTRKQSHNNGGNPRQKLSLEEKFRPVNSIFAPTIDPSVFLEQSTSQGVAKQPQMTAKAAAFPSDSSNNQFGRNSTVQNPSDQNYLSSSSKTKFHIPVDMKEPKMNGTAGQISSPEKTSTNQNKVMRIDWDGLSLAHYDGGGGTEQVSNQLPNCNRKTKEDSKKKYTSRNMGTYTDSEEEEEEADNEAEEDARSDVTMMGRAERRDGQRGTAHQQQEETDARPRRRADFNDEPQEQTAKVGNRSDTAKRTGVHQKAIQNYMKEMMEQKGEKPSQSQQANGSAVSHSNESPSASACNRPKFNLSSLDKENVDEPTFQAENSQFNRITHAHGNHSNPQTNSRNVPNYETHSNSTDLRTHDELRRPSYDQRSVCPRPATDSAQVFQLMEHVEELRRLANEKGFSHETRFDEGSFSFRRGDKLLIFTEFNEEKVRGSVHCAGRIHYDRYFPKVDWEMFSSTILGLLSLNFGG